MRQETVADHCRLIPVAPDRVPRPGGRVLDHGHFESLFQEIAQMGFDAYIRQHAAEDDLAEFALAQLQDQIVGLRPPYFVWTADDRLSIFDIRLEPVQPVRAVYRRWKDDRLQ